MSTMDLTPGAHWRRLLFVLPLAAALVLGGPMACGTDDGHLPEPEPSTDAGTDAGTEPDPEPEGAAGDPCEPSEAQAAAAIKNGWPLTSETSAVVAPTDQVVSEGYVHTAEFASLAGGSFHYLDLEGGAFANVSDAESLASPAWHVAIRRTDLRVNSGTSGPGSIKIARLTDVRFADVQTVPEDLTWAQDDAAWELVEGEDGALSCGVVGSRGKPHVAINAINQDRPLSGSWYHYNLSNHQVSTYRNTVYLLQDDAGTTWKLELVEYGPGEAGAVNVQVRWAPLFHEVCDATVADANVDGLLARRTPVFDYAANDQPQVSSEAAGVWTATINAGGGGGVFSPINAMTYLDLDDGSIASVSDFEAKADASWEIAIRRTAIRFNGGDMGPGHLRVARLDRGDVPLSAEGVSLFDDTRLAHAQGNVTWGFDRILWDWSTGLDDDENEVRVCSHAQDLLGAPMLATAYLNTDNEASGDWYAYGQAGVGPVPDTLYVVHDTARDLYWKFEITGYAAGPSGGDPTRPVEYQVRWAPLTN